MSYYENTLDKSRFLLVHRSYIVNLSNRTVWKNISHCFT